MVDNYYGYKREEWNQLSDSKKQVLRNRAYEEAKREFGDDTASNQAFPADYAAARLGLLNDGNTEFYDSLFGKYSIRSYFEDFFPNTTRITKAGEFSNAQAQLDEIADIQAARDQNHWQRRSKQIGKQYNSYSGCDITPSITVGEKTFVLGNISTISYSIHRDKTPVRVLGRSYPKSYVSAGRTIAGTLIFNVFDNHVLHDIRKAVVAESEPGIQSSPLTDQLPPFDITIFYRNEYGQSSYMRIYGLEISDEGQTHSINDMYTENIMQYVARDIDLMTKAGDEWTPQALAASNSFNQGQMATMAISSTLQIKQEMIGDIKKDMAEIQNDRYNFIQYNDRNITFSLTSEVQKYSKTASSWDDANQAALAKYNKLTAELSDVQGQIDFLTESELQSEEARLGSASSVRHDDPYNYTRTKF